MYAIVEIAGHQYKVTKDQQLIVNRLHADEGAKVQFDNVLLIDNGGDITVGAPAISGAAITAKVNGHLKGDKVIVFKKKRRKGYRKKNGFRASLTEIQIESIVASGAKAAKKAEPKKDAPKKEAAPKAEAKKAAPKAEAKKAAPKAEAKKAAPKASAKGDDLRKIEGIGPKTAEHLNNAGITSFAALAEASVERIREVLEAAGPRYKSIDPTSWPVQARMAADGQWDELKKWQEENGGSKK
ncbi:MAG: 50S ribosomal protein L21 [Flavobacteriales bacterium]